jgi:pimeloyl-ACP methyl ester carboxylesterase
MRRLRVSLLLAAVLAAAIALGPRARLDGTPRPVPLPADLDAWLVSSEAELGDVTPGTGKRIVWATADRSPTPLAIVYLHGFSATHRDTAPLAEIVAGRLGANLYLARLAGHGRGSDPMGEARAEDWLHDGREARAIGRRLGDRVVLMGHSTGATLATWLAVQDGDEALAALVLLSPNFGPVDPAAGVLLWPWGGALARLIEGPTREWDPVNALQARYFTTSYPTRALLPMMALVEGTRSAPLEQLRVPTLAFYCPRDEVVDPGAIRRTIARFGGAAELVPVEDPGDPDRHVLAGDILSPETTLSLAARIGEFLRAVMPAGEPASR